MKNLISILLIFFTFSLNAQRYTTILPLLFDTDTMTLDKVGSDSVLTFTYTINAATFNEIHSFDDAYIAQDSLDSLIILYNIYVEQKKVFVEHFYQQYKEHNSYLWNIQRQLARLEELYDDLYTP